MSEKPSFRMPFERQRCLVVADGYFEWKQEGKTKKPYYIHLKSGQAFGFAGLYNVWASPEGESICTSAIVTTDANELVKPLHDRMPVITPPDKYDLWLDPTITEKNVLMPILNPYPADVMESYPVTPKMNSCKHDNPENIEKIDVKKQ